MRLDKLSPAPVPDLRSESRRIDDVGEQHRGEYAVWLGCLAGARQELTDLGEGAVRIEPADVVIAGQLYGPGTGDRSGQGSDRAALMGESEGAPLAMLFAAAHPDRTVSLILRVGEVRERTDDDWPWGEATAEEFEAGMANLPARWGKGAGIRVIAPSVGDATWAQEWLGRVQVHAETPAAAEAFMRMAFDIDVREISGTIRVPTLILHATGDRVCHVENGRFDGVHDGPNVVHPFLEGAGSRNPIGHAHAAFVEANQPRELGEPLAITAIGRQLPVRFEMGVGTLHVDEVDRSIAMDLIGDIQVAAAGELRVRHASAPPLPHAPRATGGAPRGA
jgi:hypothetical protein